MKTTTTTPRLLSLLLTMATMFCLAAFTACSDKNEDEPEKPDTPSGPTTPTGDEFTVKATGGTVEKGDIAITFPSGTFSTETKVAVTEVAKGKTFGDAEASTFYQVTLPLNVAKDMTVSIKSDQTDGDVYLLVHAPVVALHSMEEGYGDWVAEPTYSNGTYTATLPAFENPEESESVAVSIGLAHLDRTSGTAQTRADNQNKVGNVAWHIDRGYKSTYNEARFHLFDEYIRKALTIIQGLGFKVEGDRDIPVYLADIKKDGKPEDGRFCQSPLGNKYSVLKINSSFKTKELTEQQDKELQRTIIHELLHYFQADYDPRWAATKFRNVGDDELMMYESGAPWIEKLMVNEFSNLFVYTPIMTNDGGFMRGFKNISDIYKGMNIKNARQAHAYSMPLLVEYITQQKGGDKSIVALYEGWKKEGKSSSVLGSGSITWDCYHRWATDIFGFGYNDFIDAACKGQVVPFFTAVLFAPPGDSHQFRKDDTITLTSDCYPYGGVYNNLEIFNYKNEKGESSFKNKQLKIEQKGEGLTTTVYAFETGSEVPYIKTLGKATSDAPLVITDETTLNSIHVNTATKSGYSMYVVTTSEERDKTIKSEVVATLGDADHIELIPDELTFDGKAGSQTVTADTNFEELDLKPSASWMSAAFDKTAKQITVSVETNTGDKREGTITVKGGELTATIKVTQQAGTGNLWKLVKTTIDDSGAHRENSWTSDVTGGNGSYSYKSTWMDGPRQWSGLDHDDCTGESISSTLSCDQLKDSYKPGEVIKLNVSWTYTDCAKHPFGSGPMTIAFQYVYSTGSYGWFTDENGKDTCPYINSINGTGGASNGGFPASGSGYLASPSLRTGSAGQKLEIRMSLGNIWPSYKVVYEYEWIP